MVGIIDYENNIAPAWCPGCGNFPIMKTLKDALTDLGLAPYEIVMVSGIGQSCKMPHYMRCNAFNGLHGRSLPVSSAVRLVNHKIKVINITGDGDCYGEGGNHLLHTIRRNIDIAHFVQNNQIYGLTKGQASPTTTEGTVTKNQPFGSLSEALNPIAMAVALDISFVARAFAGDTAQLKEIMKAAITHKGYSLVDILSPCVSFNKVNTYEWYRERVYKIEPEYNPEDRIEAFSRALEWGDSIPTGIIYKSNRQIMEERLPILKASALVEQGFAIETGREIIASLGNAH